MGLCTRLAHDGLRRLGRLVWAIDMIIWLSIVALIIAALMWFARTTTQRAEAPEIPPRRPPGLDVLEQRYARGEINRDEYLQKRRDLSGE